MKVLITGATGRIGRDILQSLVAHPSITTVIAFSRRRLDDSIATHRKLRVELIEDFANWNGDTLRAHMDAHAMIWCIGTYDGQTGPNYDFPVAFQEAILKVLKIRREQDGGTSLPKKFRYIHLGGRFTEHDQDKTLWFMGECRKIRGNAANKTLELAEQNMDLYEACIARPAAILPSEQYARDCIADVVGSGWSVRVEELAAYMIDVVANGLSDGPVVENEALRKRGRALLNESARDQIAS